MKNNRIGSFGISIIMLTIIVPYQVKEQVRTQAIVSPEVHPDQTVSYRIITKMETYDYIIPD
jgi:hypothetical protein